MSMPTISRLPRIVVIGASSGGTEAITALLEGLPPNLPAALFLVRHLPAYAANYLPQKLKTTSSLAVRLARDGNPIRAGALFVAPADHHLLLGSERMHLSRGPRENRARPAIDPLFRSAALAHGARTIGVILSGRLDDGTAGLLALKRSGGIAIVQDPADAANPEMPRSALRYVAVDHRVPAARIGPLLSELIGAEEPRTAEVPDQQAEDWRDEIAVLKRETGDIPTARVLGDPVPASCPECGGPLWQMKDGMLRFRCHTGHAFTAWHLTEGLGHAAETALWAALRVMEERARMLRRIAEQHSGQGHQGSSDAFLERADEADRHVVSLRELLQIAMPAGSSDTLTDYDPER